MTTLSPTHHLVRRKGGHYAFRLRVPQHLQQTLGKKVGQVSLDTTNLKEAKRRRAAQALRWAERFKAVEITATGQAFTNDAVFVQKPAPSFSERQINQLVIEYVRRETERSLKRMAGDPPENEKQKGEITT